EGAGPAARGAGAACVDPRSARAYNRCELFGDGGHVRPEGGELHGVAGGGPADAGGTVPPARAVRLDPGAHLPAADGRRRPQANPPSGPVPCPGLRSDARTAPALAGADPRRAEVAMNVRVRLFARAREIAAADAIEVSVPPGATVGELRRRLASD